MANIRKQYAFKGLAVTVSPFPAGRILHPTAGDAGGADVGAGRCKGGGSAGGGSPQQPGVAFLFRQPELAPYSTPPPG